MVLATALRIAARSDSPTTNNVFVDQIHHSRPWSKIDLLVHDRQFPSSMEDKQEILKGAVPVLVNRLELANLRRCCRQCSDPRELGAG